MVVLKLNLWWVVQRPACIFIWSYFIRPKVKILFVKYRLALITNLRASKSLVSIVDKLAKVFSL